MTMSEKARNAMWAEIERQGCGDRFSTNPAYGEIYGTVDMDAVFRAALQALREPTGELVEVIYHTETESGRFKNLVLIPRGDLIDAALQEQAQHLAPDDSANTTP